MPFQIDFDSNFFSFLIEERTEFNYKNRISHRNFRPIQMELNQNIGPLAPWQQLDTQQTA